MKLTRFKYNALLVLLIVNLSACNKDFFNQVPDDRLQIDEVFRQRANTEKYLANIYNYIRSEISWRFDGSFEGLTDDVDVTYNDMATYQMNIGNWDRNTGHFNRWNHYYRGIRSASYFIQHVDKNEEVGAEELKKWKAEARFLRAFFYANLIKQYGPVIIMPEVPFEPDATIDELSIPRSSYDECVAYIVSELEKAIPDLPKNPVNTREWNRINQGVALGIKARVLLHAASPLFNGNKDLVQLKNKDGKQLINQEYNPNKWKLAADAAKAVIDFGSYHLYVERDGNGKIKPIESLRNVHLKDWNPEIIMARTANMFDYDKLVTPRNLGGWAAFGVTQQLVDAFFMENGYPIDHPQSQYKEEGFEQTATVYYGSGTSNMYVKREPRFYVSVTFDQSKWINNDRGNGAPVVIQMYRNGNSGMYTGRNFSRTGYIARKLIDPNTTLEPDRIQARMETLLRLGEIILSYVEALNEIDPGNADIVRYLNMIRERAGIPLYGSAVGQVPVPASQEMMRKMIQQERRVELCFESIRFFDTRRWKIAENTDGGSFFGMNIEATNKQDFMKRTVFENRIWNDKMYFWNIVQDELDRNRNLIGNPGW